MHTAAILIYGTFSITSVQRHAVDTLSYTVYYQFKCGTS